MKTQYSVWLGVLGAVPFIISEDNYYLLWGSLIGFVVGLVIESKLEKKQSQKDKEYKREKWRQELSREKEQRLYIEKRASEYAEKLALKRSQLLAEDDYGDIDEEAWKAELNRFIKNKIFPIPDDMRLRMSSNPNIDESVIQEILDNIAKSTQAGLKPDKRYNKNMSGLQYEVYVAEQLNSLGWKVKVLKATGDQGVDVIAEMKGKKIAIQCKKYSSSVGNKSVQEVISGKIYYHADQAAVVTNSRYTKAAQQLANSSNVLLLHHSELNKLDSLILL